MVNRKVSKTIGNTLFPGEKPPVIGPIQVAVQHGNFEEAYREFKRLFNNEKVIGQLKERQAYEKPSSKRRRKRREAIERRLITEARDRLMKSGEWDRRMKQKEAKKQRKLEDRIRRQTELEDFTND